MVNTEFVDALASDAAVPGGGGGAAYAGALAAALGAMVGNITAGKPKFADIADDMRASVVELDAARTRLLELIDEDAEAFSRLAATWKLSRATEEEKAARPCGRASGACRRVRGSVAHHARVRGRNRVRRIPREPTRANSCFPMWALRRSWRKAARRQRRSMCISTRILWTMRSRLLRSTRNVRNF